MALVFVITLLLAFAPPAPAQRPQRPEWVQNGLVMASNMEALSFVRRRGGQAANYAELWQKEQSEDAILALKVQGVNTVLISLMKGAGIKAEADDIEAARKYVELAHRHGMKVGGYVGASIFFETMFDEEPDSVNWIQRDEEGRPLYYNPTQTFRYMANRNHPGYHDYVKRILKLGIGDLKLDFVHFDQMMWWRLPYVSQTELDQQMFRDFVHAKYPPGRMKERFGFTQMKRLRLPEFGLNSPITWSEVLNPAVQEMVQFRSFTLAERFREYDEYIHQLNPQAALQANPHLDPSANNALMYGIDVPQLLAHGDIITSEERNEPQYTADGRLVSRIRTYLAGRIMAKPILFWQQPATIVGRPAHHTLQSPQKLRLAEALAWCNNCVGLTAGMDVGNLRFPQDAQNYIDFYWKRNELLANAESAAEIAVLRSFPSVELNASQVLPPLVLFEQSLIQAQIPFDTIFDRHLNNLSRYKVLVLANQDALSDQQLETIRTYVSAGGSIIATDQTSMFNDWRQRRPQLGLSKVFQFDHVPSEIKRVQYGNGRAVFIPKVQPAMQPPAPQLYYVFRNEFWKLAKNHAEMVQAVRWALNGAPAVQITAPDSLAINFTEQKLQNRRILHLVNYRVTAPVLNVGIQFRVPAGKRLKQAVLETPDGGAPSKLTFTTANQIASLTVPKVTVYSLLAFEMEDRR